MSDTFNTIDKVEILRLWSHSVETSDIEFTVADEAAFYLQLFMIDLISDFIFDRFNASDSPDLAIARKIEITNCFIFSAYLVKKPSITNPNYDADFDSPDENAPMNILASRYLLRSADSLEESKNQISSTETNNKDVINAIDTRVKKLKQISAALISDYDRPSDSILLNSIISCSSGKFLVRPGFVYPMPLYVLIPEERKKPSRWYYNTELKHDFLMPYDQCGFGNIEIPSNCLNFGRSLY